MGKVKVKLIYELVLDCFDDSSPIDNQAWAITNYIINKVSPYLEVPNEIEMEVSPDD